MNVHARISNEWRRRMILMALMINGSGLWFLYDGCLAWPSEAKRYEKLVEITVGHVPEGKKLDDKDPAIIRAWEQYASQNDLPAKVPKNRTEGDISAQRIIGGILLFAGVAFVGWVLLQHRKSVRADGDIITGADGEQVHLDSVVDMDRRKWRNKGIAYAIYEKDGKRLRLCLDDHKFIGCEEIILEAERRIAGRSGNASAQPPEA